MQHPKPPDSQAAHLHDALHGQFPHTGLITLPQDGHKRPQRLLLMGVMFQLSTCQQLCH
jgi:hypothetical protein